MIKIKNNLFQFTLIINCILFSAHSVFAQGGGRWKASAPMNSPRYAHSLAALPNGNILAIGGNSLWGEYRTCEIYDVKLNQWKYTDTMSFKRSSFKSVVLDNGKILVIGSGAIRFCELYDPIKEKWAVVDSTIGNRIQGYTALKLKNGKVLVIGGKYYANDKIGYVYTANCDLFDPATNKWTLAGPLNVPREYLTATLLDNGKVFITGGFSHRGFLKSCELYDPDTDAWELKDSLGEERVLHTATLLDDGNILVAGGYNGRVYGGVGGYWPVSCELFNTKTNKWSQVGDKKFGAISQQAFRFQNGNILYAGGGLSRYWEIYDSRTFSQVYQGTLPVSNDHAECISLDLNQVLYTGGRKLIDDLYLTASECFIYIQDSTAAVKIRAGQASEFELYQNYPNPFNPVTTIRYIISKDSHVELKVYDMLGREVSTLFNKEQSAGEYKVQFDGSSLPSGVYIYTLQAGSFRESRKLLLLK